MRVRLRLRGRGAVRVRLGAGLGLGLERRGRQGDERDGRAPARAAHHDGSPEAEQVGAEVGEEGDADEERVHRGDARVQRDGEQREEESPLVRGWYRLRFRGRIRLRVS